MVVGRNRPKKFFPQVVSVGFLSFSFTLVFCHYSFFLHNTPHQRVTLVVMVLDSESSGPRFEPRSLPFSSMDGFINGNRNGKTGEENNE